MDQGVYFLFMHDLLTCLHLKYKCNSYNFMILFVLYTLCTEQTFWSALRPFSM